MPEFGKTFINAIGVEVVAHGGRTPKAPSIVERKSARVERGDLVFDQFGRTYDNAVPAFLISTNGMVYDRLATITEERGNVVTLQSLLDRADEIGYVIPEGEIDAAPDWWLTNNPLWDILLGEIGPALTQPPVIAGDSVDIGETLELTQIPLWDGTEDTSSWVWQINGVPQAGSEDAPTFVIPLGTELTDVYRVEATATSEVGTIVKYSNSLTGVSPAISTRPILDIDVGNL